MQVRMKRKKMGWREMRIKEEERKKPYRHVYKEGEGHDGKQR